MAGLAFYILSAVVIVAALGVIGARNPVHSVLFLILTFFTSAGLLVLIGAEFLAALLVVVYVGAVAVLFLFVVMMLDVDFVELKQGFLSYLPVAGLVGIALIAEIVLVTTAAGEILPERDDFNSAPGIEATPLPELSSFAERLVDRIAGTRIDLSELTVTNAESIGQVLFTRNLLLFQVAGLILLVAMIGAIVLTLRHRPGVKRQNVARQTGRRREDAVELVDIEPGKGI